MTPSETYRMYGALTRGQIENLIDTAESVESADGVDGYIDEARCMYPSEDFLEEPIKALNELAKGMRGEKRIEIEAIANQLREILTNTTNSSDYGREQLDKATTALAQLKP